ncbi:TPA: hypothetical protein PXN48_000655 [Yersinia enterocolitica]|nr:hypothetical protein [Yersinia enterocolitica]
MDNGSVTFFDINACGFYRLKHKAKDLDHKFGTISEVFEDLKQWLVGKSIEETIPWDVNVHAIRSKTYCRGVAIDPETKDIVMVVLRAVGDGSGNLHGVRVGSQVGENESDTVLAGDEKDGDKIIWGEPCYYWIIPEHNKMASIIFPHSGADTVRFSNYLINHINNNGSIGAQRKQTSSNINPHNAPEKTITVVRTTFPYGEGKDKCNCFFKFDVEQTKIKTAMGNLAEIRQNITHTIIRDTTTTRVADERQPILRLASTVLKSLFGAEIGEQPALQAPKRVEVIIDGAPSDEEIEALFAQRKDETDWVDVGFKVKDSEIPIWLTKYVVKSAIAIEDSTGLSHYSPQKLLAEIKKVRQDLLDPVLTDKKVENEAGNEGEAEANVAEA